MPHVLEHWQDAGYAYMQTRQHPALFWEMRLGKAVVTLRDISVRAALQLRRVLWVSSTSSFRDWKVDCEHEGLPYTSYQGLPPKRRQQALVDTFESDKFEVSLINYELLRAEPVIAKFPWEYVVMDESVKLKNPQAEVTKIAVGGFGAVPRRVILSGNPAPEDPLEYFSQFQFLHGVFMGCRDYWNFRSKYFEPSPWNRYDWKPLPGMRSQIAGVVSSKASVLLRSQVRSHVEKNYSVRSVPPTTDQVKLMKQIAKELAWFHGDTGAQTNYPLVKETWLRRIAGGFTPDTETVISSRKIEQLLALLKGEFRGQRVVVWCAYKAELSEISASLSANGITHVSVHGDVKPLDKDRLQDEFVAGRARVHLATIASVARGKNLAVADVAIYYSNDWSSDLRTQSEDRIISVKKLYPTLILDLVTEDSVDEEAVSALRDKRIDARMILAAWVQKWAA